MHSAKGLFVTDNTYPTYEWGEGKYIFAIKEIFIIPHDKS